MTPNPIRIARTLLLLLILLAGCATPAENLPAAVHTVEAAITALPDKVPPTVGPATPTARPPAGPLDLAAEAPSGPARTAHPPDLFGWPHGRAGGGDL